MLQCGMTCELFSYLCAVAGALWSVFERKCLQESEEALNQENHSISDLHQVLAREMKLLFLLLILCLVHFHLRITAKGTKKLKERTTLKMCSCSHIYNSHIITIININV